MTEKLSYRYERGNIPVMVSAPHSVSHMRNGKVKCADMLTGAFAKLLHFCTGCHSFYKIRNDGFDPNFYDEESDGGYKKELLNIIKRENIKVLIDLHGAAEGRDFDVDMGTDYGSSLNGYDFIPGELETIFNSWNITNIGCNKEFAASGNTVTHFISSNAKIPCIQLEINKKFRDTNREQNLQSMISALISAVNYLKGYRCIFSST